MAITDESFAFILMNLLHLDLPRVSQAHPSAASTPGHAPWANQEEGPSTISERLQELEDEWTIEGMFETCAGVVGVAALVLGLMVDDRWLVLPLVLSLLLLQQTLQGWCPALPLLRGLGFRTEAEIHRERHELQQMEEERAEWQHPVWVKTESPSMPSPALARASFSLQDFLVRPAR